MCQPQPGNDSGLSTYEYLPTHPVEESESQGDLLYVQYVCIDKAGFGKKYLVFQGLFFVVPITSFFTPTFLSFSPNPLKGPEFNVYI